MTRRRNVNLKIHDHAYTRVGNLDGRCVYCGELAEVWDHVPPISWADSVDREATRVWFACLPACGECNVILSDRPIFEISARCWETKKGLRRKYRKVLQMPEWEEEELAALTPAMRLDVTRHLALARQIRKRISFPVLKIYD